MGLKQRIRELEAEVADLRLLARIQREELRIQTGSDPVTYQQLAIAWAKWLAGYRPGEELWSEHDSAALAFAISGGTTTDLRQTGYGKTDSTPGAPGHG